MRSKNDSSRGASNVEAAKSSKHTRKFGELLSTEWWKCQWDMNHQQEVGMQEGSKFKGMQRHQVFQVLELKIAHCSNHESPLACNSARPRLVKHETSASRSTRRHMAII